MSTSNATTISKPGFISMSSLWWRTAASAHEAVVAATSNCRGSRLANEARYVAHMAGNFVGDKKIERFYFLFSGLEILYQEA